MDLVPVGPLRGMAQVLTFGATKYSERGWEDGIKFGRIYAAAMRHLMAWWDGEVNDSDSGLPHLHHAMCCVAMLAEYHAKEKYKEFDDRPLTEMPKKRKMMSEAEFMNYLNNRQEEDEV